MGAFDQLVNAARVEHHIGVGGGTAINIAARHIIPRIEAGEIHPEFFVIANPDVVFDPGSIDELIESPASMRGMIWRAAILMAVP